MDELYSKSGMTRRRVLGGALATTAGVSAMALVGCGGDDDEDAPSGGATTAPGAQTSPSAAIKIPDEFVVANEAEPDDLMPYFGGFGQALVMRQVYETLIEINLIKQADGSVKTEFLPQLAESWERKTPTEIAFKLRAGVKFHDGTDWNAEAAKFAFETMSDAKLATSLKKSAFLARYMKSVAVADPMTVVLTLNSALNDQELFGIGIRLGYSAFSPKAFAEKGGFAGMAESPVGTGPYKFESWKRGQDIRLVANDAYWGKKPNMKKVTYITRKEASVRAQTVKSGEAHFAYNIGAEQASSLEKSVVGGGFQSNSLRLNNGTGPTKDIRVRQAINYALDRDGINKAIFKGTATPIGFFAYQPVNVKPWTYDLARAKTLIDQAGVKGQELELVYGESRIPEENQLAEIFKAQIEAAGLKVKLTKLEAKQYNEVGGKPFAEQPSLFMETTSSGNYGEIASSLTDKYGCTGSGTFCSPAFDAEFVELQTLTGEDRLKKLRDVADRLQNNEVPRAWVLAVNQVHGLSSNVKTNFPLNVYIRWTDVSFG